MRNPDHWATAAATASLEVELGSDIGHNPKQLSNIGVRAAQLQGKGKKTFLCLEEVSVTATQLSDATLAPLA